MEVFAKMTLERYAKLETVEVEFEKMVETIASNLEAKYIQKIYSQEGEIAELKRTLYGASSECGCYTSPGGRTTTLCDSCADRYSPF